MNKNDDRILKLKKQIETKKNELGDMIRYNPTTNCVLKMNNEVYNLNVLTKDQLILLLCQLNALNMSAIDLKLPANSPIICGYYLLTWIEDIQGKLKLIDRKQKEGQLEILEKKLKQLLSEDKKIELEIDEIEELLK
jgi:hypothetical protein